MPSYVALSRELHARRQFKPVTSFRFAAQQASVVLVGAEMPKACMGLPLGFLRHADKLWPIALLGTAPERNLFVAEDGRWIGGYVPALFRAYPFRFADLPNGDKALCFDEEAQLIAEQNGGQPLFEADGNPTRIVTDIANFLQQLDRNQRATELACKALDEAGVIQPWEIKIRSGAGELVLNGILRADESRLNALDDQSFLTLRRAGALMIAHCQLLSMMHLPILGRLAEAHAKRAEQLQKVLAESFIMPESDTLNFG